MIIPLSLGAEMDALYYSGSDSETRPVITNIVHWVLGITYAQMRIVLAAHIGHVLVAI